MKQLDATHATCMAFSLLWFVLPVAEGELFGKPFEHGGWPMALTALDGRFVPALALSGLLWTALLWVAKRAPARFALVVLSLVSAAVTAGFLTFLRVLLGPEWRILPTWYVCMAGSAGVLATTVVRLAVSPEGAAERGSEASDEELACPSCGLGYRLSEYREEAREPRCSRCKALLPADEHAKNVNA